MEKPYAKLAEYYDYLQGDIDYTIWKEWVKEKTPKFQTEILEVGCGTGKLANMLVTEGIHVEAFDISDAMIYEAQKKYPKINFYQDDMRTFKTDKKYDVIICFMDTINYLLEEKDIESFFNQAYKALKKNGILLFDIHQLDNLDNFHGYMESGYIDKDMYSWESLITDGEKNIVTHSFKFEVGDSIYKEKHQQRIMSVEFYQKIWQEKFEHIEIKKDNYRLYIELQKKGD